MRRHVVAAKVSSRQASWPCVPGEPDLDRASTIFPDDSASQVGGGSDVSEGTKALQRAERRLAIERKRAEVERQQLSIAQRELAIAEQEDEVDQLSDRASDQGSSGSVLPMEQESTSQSIIVNYTCTSQTLWTFRQPSPSQKLGSRRSVLRRMRKQLRRSRWNTLDNRSRRCTQTRQRR